MRHEARYCCVVAFIGKICFKNANIDAIDCYRDSSGSVRLLRTKIRSAHEAFSLDLFLFASGFHESVDHVNNKQEFNLFTILDHIHRTADYTASFDFGADDVNHLFGRFFSF